MTKADQMTQKTGGCMCGAVRFAASEVPVSAGICHCPQCRRWTGTALVGVTVPSDKVVWEGEAHIARYQSSDWAERAFCKKCGSSLFYRVTADNEWAGGVEIPLGLFDDPNGFDVTSEIFIDQKPDGFAFAGEGRKVLTRADCVAKFPLLDSDQ